MMKLSKIGRVTLAIAMIAASAQAPGEEDDRYLVSRYTSISTKPEARQANPLLTVVSFSFPPAVETVGQAINYTLDQTGYTIVEPSNLPEQAKIMMSLPLPNIQRKFTYVTVKSTLATLAGDAFVLLVDPIRRKITFVPVFNDGAEGKANNGVNS